MDFACIYCWYELEPATHIHMQKQFNDSICRWYIYIVYDYDNCDIIEVMIYRCDIRLNCMHMDVTGCYSFEITWIVDVYDDAMITCQFRLCITRTV